MTRLRRCLTGLLAMAVLLLAIACLGASEPAGERRVMFEEVGEYSDGGMAVALLVVGDYVYLCEFDRGVVILDVSDPETIVRIGQLPGTAQAEGSRSLTASPTSRAT